MEVLSPDGEESSVSWIVIGGGVHGTAISIALRAAGVSAPEILVIDPHAVAFSEFARLCMQTGMEFMRSPAEHHLDRDPDSLRRFAEEIRSRRPVWSSLGNPSCDIWLRHSAKVVREAGASQLRRKGEVTDVRPTGSGYEVETTNGRFFGRNLVVAPGIGYGPNWPWWARHLMQLKPAPQVFHAFDQGVVKRMRVPSRAPIVIGGGITAAQLALRYAELRRPDSPPVTLISYHPLRASEFDCDTVWMNADQLSGFRTERCFERRRSVVDASKVRGTVTPEVHRQLEEAVGRGAIRILIARIMAAAVDAQNEIVLTLSDDSKCCGDVVALATGFAHQHRSSNLLAMLQRELQLPCNSHGDPIVGPNLSWGRSGLFVAGALAELELGPFAGNIIGARWASERIVGV